MNKSLVNAKISKKVENGVTVITILGLENNPKAYKDAYLQLMREIELQKFKLLNAGLGFPIVRVLPSLEIH